MNLQETLLKVFNKKIKRSDFLTNWYAKDLKDFSDDELKQLFSTCLYFKHDSPKLSKTVQARIINERLRRDKERRTPKIKVTKNKGKKR